METGVTVPGYSGAVASPPASLFRIRRLRDVACAPRFLCRSGR